MPRRNKIQLPPLIFGEERMVLHRSYKTIGDILASHIPNLQYFEPVGDKNLFMSKISHVDINDMSVASQSCSEIISGVDLLERCTFEFCSSGYIDVLISGKAYKFGDNNRGLLSKGFYHRYGKGSIRNHVLFALNEARLKKTAALMLGRRDENFDLYDGATQKLVDLNCRDVNYANVFNGLCKVIDSMDHNKEQMERVGLDDVFYRYIATLVAPSKDKYEESGGAQPSNTGSNGLSILYDALNEIRSNPLTLTEMEQLSGFSARALQYYFKRQFGCAPMAWQRKTRSAVARNILMRDGKGVKIEDLALNLGFSSPSRFSAYYLKEFGESPVETRIRKRWR